MNTQDQNNARLAEMPRHRRVAVLTRTFGVDSDTVAVGLDRMEEGESITKVFGWKGGEGISVLIYTQKHIDFLGWQGALDLMST